MPIKILHLITDLNTGGTEISLYRLLSGMDRTRYDNRVVSLLPTGPIGELIRALDIPVVSLDLKPGQPTLGALFKLTSWLRHERPDILQTWLYHADLLGLLAARLAQVQTVVWNIRSSNMDLSRYRRLSEMVQRGCIWLSGWPQAIISNSQAGQDYHSRLGYHPRRWAIIHNGVDVQMFKPDLEARLALRRTLGFNPETILIGQIARFDPMKNQMDFLKAAGKLTRDGIEAQYLMIGQDVTSENIALMEIVRQETLEGRVHMLGRLDDMPRIETTLDILTSTSSGEGFPNVVAEAMACGVPCVVTDVGDSAFLVGDTGVVVPPNDPQAIARGWQKLIDAGIERRQQLGEIARLRIQQYFSLQKMTSAYQDLYRTLAPGHGEKVR